MGLTAPTFVPGKVFFWKGLAYLSPYCPTPSSLCPAMPPQHKSTQRAPGPWTQEIRICQSNSTYGPKTGNCIWFSGLGNIPLQPLKNNETHSALKGQKTENRKHWPAGACLSPGFKEKGFMKTFHCTFNPNTTPQDSVSVAPKAEFCRTGSHQQTKIFGQEKLGKDLSSVAATHHEV